MHPAQCRQATGGEIGTGISAIQERRPTLGTWRQQQAGMVWERRQSTRILYAGTDERDCPRNGLTMAALDQAGFDVRELHAPVWERDHDKSGCYLRPGSLLRLGLRLAKAYGSIGIRLIRALPDADAVVIGLHRPDGYAGPGTPGEACRPSGRF